MLVIINPSVGRGQGYCSQFACVCVCCGGSLVLQARALGCKSNGPSFSAQPCLAEQGILLPLLLPNQVPGSKLLGKRMSIVRVPVCWLSPFRWDSTEVPSATESYHAPWLMMWAVLAVATSSAMEHG